ncbi:RnfH family protein [Luteimonas sp. e5]
MSTIEVEVVVAWPDRVESRRVLLRAGARVGEAVAASGLAEGFELAGVAVFGRRAGMDSELVHGDRVELLRALVIDPKQARRQRAEAAQKLKKTRAR